MTTEGWSDKETQTSHEQWAERVAANVSALATLTTWALRCAEIDRRNDAAIGRELARRESPPVARCAHCGRGDCVCKPCERCGEMPWDCQFYDHRYICPKCEAAKVDVIGDYCAACITNITAGVPR